MAYSNATDDVSFVLSWLLIVYNSLIEDDPFFLYVIYTSARHASAENDAEKNMKIFSLDLATHLYPCVEMCSSVFYENQRVHREIFQNIISVMC